MKEPSYDAITPRSFGAVGDGATDDTAAVQACFDAGEGGIVEIPAGTFVVGTVLLRSGTTLRLAQGAVLRGSDDAEHYADRAVLWVRDGRDVVIEGPGEINGSGPRWWPELLEDDSWRPGPLVVIQDCVDVVVREVTLRDSPSWTLKVHRSERVLIDGIRIRALVAEWPESANTDGIDICASQHIEIAHCDIETADDAIALKTDPGDGPIAHVEIHDCTLAGWAHGFTIGLETWGDVHDVVFRDSVIRPSRETNPGTTYFAAVSLVSMHGARIRDITVERITVEEVQCPIFMRVQGGGAFPDDVPLEPGCLENVIIRDFEVQKATFGSAILGIPERPIGSVLLENVSITSAEGGTEEDADRLIDEFIWYPQPVYLGKMPAHGIYFRDVDGPVEARGVRITSTADEERPTLLLERADGVSTDGFEGSITVAHRPAAGG